MKFTKYIFLIFSISLLSCSQKTLTINSSEKRINYPGIASASPFVGYEISFESLYDFKIDKVELNDTNKIKEFSLYNEKTKSSISSANLLKKGKYTLSFKVKNIKGIDDTEKITIYILSNDKVEKKTANIITKAPFRAR
ncbi:hypothetical protein [Polaribacter uvawellassae]|uniref:hypothetical protein n=1 Tax=Polaribacter uvawellassae TaxID=3133495 RepID=UPI00321B72B9